MVQVAVIRQNAARDGGWNEYALPVIKAQNGFKVLKGD
jgi:hypothetical protein